MRIRIASSIVIVPVPLSVAPDDPSHESKCDESTTYSSGFSLPLVRFVLLGDLDVLLCDLPPGTGDVSISLASFIPGASMVVVTTPQEAARTVAARAGKMAERTNLRAIGVIENMS